MIITDFYKKVNMKHDKLLMEVYTQLTVKCKCGHSIVFKNQDSKKICNWCWRTVYNKNEIGQKQKFKDELEKAERKIKKYEKINN